MGFGIANQNNFNFLASVYRQPLRSRLIEIGMKPKPATTFQRRLNLFDSTAIVVGSMIGSGIFLVSADMARNLGSPGWLLVAWAITGILTVIAALEHGELAVMMPHAGGQYVYLREAYNPLGLVSYLAGRSFS